MSTTTERLPQAPVRLPRPSAATFALGIGAAALVIVSIGQVAPSPVQMANGLPNMVNLLDRMTPPNTDPAFLTRIFWRIVETFQIALAGAAIGIALSLPLGWLAARGASPLGGWARC